MTAKRSPRRAVTLERWPIDLAYEMDRVRGPIPVSGSGKAATELGVFIVDRRNGVNYAVTVVTHVDADGVETPALTSVWKRAQTGDLDGAVLIPESRLASYAHGFLMSRASDDAGIPGFLIIGDQVETSTEPAAVAKRPTESEIARQVRIATATGTPQADHFAFVYGITSATTERWVRRAREANALPPRAPGRHPQRPSTPSGVDAAGEQQQIRDNRSGRVRGTKSNQEGTS